ncbi:amidohydrolase [Bradyrhizobium sp. dw_411]|uniref:amidohydrolase n=1 Tax=Bradyrhizobium sp. dw_411 TaxID=2720082 RepID=UPI00201C4B65|nr:amidohydrolase [Bradyrhizobium sp. dw_411]
MRDESHAVWHHRDMRLNKSLARCCVALAMVMFGFAAPAWANPADILLVNGKIITLDATSSVHGALAIEGGRIAATGSNEAMRKQAGPATKIIDLGGRTVIPGLIDSHIHAIRAGFRYATEVHWDGATDIKEAMERLRVAAAQTKPGSWLIVAGGWTARQFRELRRPTETEINVVAGEHPVYIQLFYGSMLLNARGRELLGIGSEEDLLGAKYDRDTGWITGPASLITSTYARLPKPDMDQAIDGTRRFLRELSGLGITGVIDPGGHNLDPEDYAALFALWREHALPLRVVYSICAQRPGKELEDFQAFTRFLPMGTGDDWLRFNGIGETVTFGMYNNETPTEANKEEFYRVARWAASQGMTLTVHWNNEASVHHLLDVFERVNREIPLAKLRWSIAHLHDASDSSLQRMKALGVGWLMQDGLYFAAPSYIAERGPDQMSHTPPIVSALKLEIPVGGGTDANRVMVPNPFVSLRWMLDGRTVDGIATRGPQEIPSREAALRLYTIGSAWFAHDDNRRGRLMPGMLADLAVLSDDYFSVELSRVAQIHSVLTMVGGKVVFAAAPFAELEAGRGQ